jgi:hypothetical protein
MRDSLWNDRRSAVARMGNSEVEDGDRASCKVANDRSSDSKSRVDFVIGFVGGSCMGSDIMETSVIDDAPLADSSSLNTLKAVEDADEAEALRSYWMVGGGETRRMFGATFVLEGEEQRANTVKFLL